MYSKSKETSKISFRSLLNNESATKVSFHYDNTGNEVFNPCGTYQKQTVYEFYVYITDKNDIKMRHLLVLKQHRRSDDIVEKELVEKYSRWAKQIGCEVIN